MSRRVRVTVLVENTAQGLGLLAEHGLAYWIECGGQRVLFDTGQGMVLQHNASRLNIPLELADAIVLSHGHYDHTGGLAQVLQAGRPCPIYLHPAAFAKKFTREKNGAAREVGVPEASETAAWAHSSPLILTKEPTEIVPDLMVTGPVPRETAFEDTGGPFYLDAQFQEPDPLLDDQALFFQTMEGTVVLLGCAHAGVINTLRHVQRLTGGQPIHAVLGGMHLVRASRERMAQTIDAFRQLNIARLGPAHCTGLNAVTELWSALPGKCFPCNVGTVVEFVTSR